MTLADQLTAARKAYRAAQTALYTTENEWRYVEDVPPRVRQAIAELERALHATSAEVWRLLDLQKAEEARARREAGQQLTFL